MAGRQARKGTSSYWLKGVDGRMVRAAVVGCFELSRARVVCARRRAGERGAGWMAGGGGGGGGGWLNTTAWVVKAGWIRGGSPGHRSPPNYNVAGIHCSK